MRITTAMNHLDMLKGHQSEAYFFARFSGWSHARLLESTAGWRAKFADILRRCPGWVHTVLVERGSTFHRELYKPNLHANELGRMLAKAKAGEDVKPAAYLRWALRVDGTEVTTDDICARRDAEPDIWDRVEGTHIWNHTGTPFSPWKLTNPPLAPKGAI